MNRRTLLIVDDHPLVRHGIRALLQSQPDFRVVGEAAEGMTALHLVEQLQPDMVVLDIVMPGVGGLDLLRQLNRSGSQTKVIVLSLHDDAAYMQEAMRLGAAGYVLKHSASTNLIPAVRAALAGRFFSDCTSVGATTSSSGEPRPVTDRASLLTQEEHRVLRLLATGMRDEDITAQLGRPTLPLPLLCRNIALKLGLAGAADVRAHASRWAQPPP
ncbi:MAG: response regulator transcription factor [Limisphaerales bacterium]